jgi:hypothetical protein
VNLKEKNYPYVYSTTQRCKKTIKTFLIEDFFHFLLVSTTPVVEQLELPISSQIFKKICNCPNGIGILRQGLEKH